MYRSTKFYRQKSVEHSFRVCLARFRVIDRWMLVRIVDSLSERNEHLSAKQPNRLELLLRSAGVSGE